MDFWRYIYIYYVIITWGTVFFLMKPRRIKELLPIALIGIIILFSTEKYLLTLDLFRFPNAVFPIFGVPFFHLIWGGAAAMIFLNFMPQNFAKKLLTVLVFTGITLLFEYFPEHHGKAQHIGKYSEIHDAIQDFFSLVLVLWFSEGFFGKRIHSNSKS